MASDEKSGPVQGLCSTCIHGPDCQNCNEEAIFYCENYEDSLTHEHELQPSAVPVGVAAAEGEDRLMGLCVNCERRGYCTNARKLGGVWVCEEYL
ncbi:hypothetical protein EHM69_00375 [candidate division KSB1 bacterium]|nr:MAG: hypothetical protein EHM69_00375 [candidate division KSB1 bacterium]